MMGELYRLTFPNGKAYIGITSGSSCHRYKGHAKDARRHRISALHSAWKKYGPPVMQVLAVLENQQLGDAEIKAIALLKTLVPHGYNTATGGFVNPPGYRHTTQAKAKISAHNAMKHRSDVRAKVSATMTRTGYVNHATLPAVRAKISSTMTAPSFAHPMKDPSVKARHLAAKRSPEGRAKTAQAIREHWKTRRLTARKGRQAVNMEGQHEL